MFSFDRMKEIINFELRSKIKCTSELKINTDLFCTSLDCCYLCREIQKSLNYGYGLV